MFFIISTKREEKNPTFDHHFAGPNRSLFDLMLLHLGLTFPLTPLTYTPTESSTSHPHACGQRTKEAKGTKGCFVEPSNRAEHQLLTQDLE